MLQCEDRWSSHPGRSEAGFSCFLVRKWQAWREILKQETTDFPTHAKKNRREVSSESSVYPVILRGGTASPLSHPHPQIPHAPQHARRSMRGNSAATRRALASIGALTSVGESIRGDSGAPQHACCPHPWFPCGVNSLVQ